MNTIKTYRFLFTLFIVPLFCGCSNNNQGSDEDNLDEYFICYRPQHKNSNWFWNRGTHGSNTVRYAKNYDDLPCDCFVKGEKVTGDINFLKGTIDPGSNQMNVTHHNATLYLKKEYQDYKRYTNVNPQSMQPQLTGNDGAQKYAEYGASNLNWTDDYILDENTHAFHCDGAGGIVTFSCPSACSGTTRIAGACLIKEEDFDPRNIPDVDYLSSDLHPIFRTAQTSVFSSDFVFSLNQDTPPTTDPNSEDIRYMLVKIVVPESLYESAFTVSLNLPGNTAQYLRFSNRNEQEFDENSPILKYCRDGVGGHIVVLKFKIKKSGHYTLKLVDESQSTIYQQNVTVAATDLYEEPDFPNLTSHSSRRELKLNILKAPGVPSLSEITDGPYTSFEKTIEDAYSNRNRRVRSKATTEPNDFDFQISTVKTFTGTAPTDPFDSHGNLKLRFQDYDDFYGLSCLSNYTKEVRDKRAFDYALNIAYYRLMLLYYNQGDPLTESIRTKINSNTTLTPADFSSIDLLDLNQVLVFTANSVAFYDNTGTTRLTNKERKSTRMLEAQEGLIGHTGPINKSVCGSNELPYNGAIPAIFTRSVVGVFLTPYTTTFANPSHQKFGLVYTAIHEIAHTWAQPYLTDPDVDSDDDPTGSHNNYSVGLNADDNVFRYTNSDSEFQNAILKAFSDGVVFSEYHLNVIMNQLVRKQIN